MNMKKISHEMNLKKWTQIVEECRNSGQTAKAWCEENNINIKTYYYWKRRVCNAVYNELAIANGNKAVPVFTEVKIAKGRSLDVAITLNINNISLEIHNGAEERVIAQTLRLLGSI